MLLSKRLAAATGPDPELDEALWNLAGSPHADADWKLPLTASLDAITALVEQVLPVVEIHLHKIDGEWGADLWGPKDGMWKLRKWLPSAALALCVALAKALEAKEGK